MAARRPVVCEIFSTEESALEALAGPDREAIPLRWAPASLQPVDRGNLTVLRMPAVSGASWDARHEYEEGVRSLVRERGRHRLLINLEEVATYQSGFLNMLARILFLVARSEGVLALCEVPERLLEIMEICRLPLAVHPAG